MRHKRTRRNKEKEGYKGLMAKMHKCRECRFIDYFSSEDKYWCHQQRRYINPEDGACENFKPKIKGPLDKYVW